MIRLVLSALDPQARQEGLMDAKKLVVMGVLLFVGFWMFTDPRGLADLTKVGAGQGWDLLAQGLEGLIRFVKAVV